MDTMTSIQDKATEALKWFETAYRIEGDEESAFTRTKDGAPDWVRTLVQDAHGGNFLPDDFRYESIRDALDWIADDREDDAFEFAYESVDVYTGRMLAWLGSNLQRVGYVDEAVEELGHSDQGITGDITAGQAAELAEIYGLVRQSLEA